MREILFRGLHRRYGEKVNMAGDKLPAIWVYGGVLQGNGDMSIIYGSKSPDGEFESKYPVYSDTLGQFTGLCDKNGKRIFEGDVLRCNIGNVLVADHINPWCEEFESIVHCDDGMFFLKTQYSTTPLATFAKIPINEGVYPWERKIVGYKNSVEVIGNIHDTN